MNPICFVLIIRNSGCFVSTGIGWKAIPGQFANYGERNKFFDTLLEFRTAREKIHKIPVKASIVWRNFTKLSALTPSRLWRYCAIEHEFGDAITHGIKQWWDERLRIYAARWTCRAVNAVPHTSINLIRIVSFTAMNGVHLWQCRWGNWQCWRFSDN
jgi:hypothetical protein